MNILKHGHVYRGGGALPVTVIKKRYSKNCQCCFPYAYICSKIFLTLCKLNYCYIFHSGVYRGGHGG